MILEALVDKLQTASVGTVATNVFIGLMPDQPDKVIALYEYAGQAPLEVFRNETATIEVPTVIVMARAARNDYPTARAFLEDARDALCGIIDETISNVRFLRVAEASSINYVNTDDNDRPRFTVSLTAYVER
jgi:hypothetical protein